VDEKYRILIVDDDAAVREAYREILTPNKRPYLSDGDRLFGGLEPTDTSLPYRIWEAKDGVMAVQSVQAAKDGETPFSLAFVDMKMPGLNGAETARELWRIDPKIKIVFVTAHSDVTPDEIVQVTAREDLFYLQKPFNPQEIRQFARALCRQGDLERERDMLAESLRDANRALADMNRNLERKVKQQAEMLIQSEKMASLGVLVAGVAHEINNPLSFIKANLSSLGNYAFNMVALLEKYQALTASIAERSGDHETSEPRPLTLQIQDIHDFRRLKKIDFILEDLPDLVSQSLEGTDRIEAIIHDLRNFSRMDDNERSIVNINESMDTALNILQNQIEGGVEIVRDYGELPPVSCFPQKLIQAVMNILINAAHAVTEEGTIRITTRTSKKNRENAPFVEIEIADTGCGMPEADMKKIFDPFFTTKPVDRGMGLGLYITYEIVHAHGGTIGVESREGVGSTFTVTLPAQGLRFGIADGVAPPQKEQTHDI